MLAPVPSGKDKTRHPANKYNGVRGSSRSSLDNYDSSLELTRASTSVSVVDNSSCDSLALPIVFLKHRFTAETHVFALSEITCVGIPLLAVKCLKALRNIWVFISGTNSRCVAPVAQYENTKTTLCNFLMLQLLKCIVDQHSLPHNVRTVELPMAMVVQVLCKPSSLRHLTHLYEVFLTNCLPFANQYLNLTCPSLHCAHSMHDQDSKMMLLT